MVCEGLALEVFPSYWLYEELTSNRPPESRKSMRVMLYSMWGFATLLTIMTLCWFLPRLSSDIRRRAHE